MIDLMHGDCLELMKNIPDDSIDMVLTDPPYGTTQCKWDSVIDFELMWTQLKRVTKNNGAICLFGAQPFTAALIMSNPKMYKYDWVWQKNKATNHLNAKKQPLRLIELVSVFYKNQCLYNPVKTTGHKRRIANTKYEKTKLGEHIYGIEKRDTKYDSTERYPNGLLQFSNANKKNKVHPTQKPVALLEYLIKTYTLENEMVLDFTMGSGSTGVACKNLNRKFIGIEQDDAYFEIAKNRINDHNL